FEFRWRIARRFQVRQFPTCRRKETCEISILNQLRTETLNRIAAFCQRLLGIADRIIEGSHCLVRSARHQVADGLILEHQAVQVLEQSIVQFTCDSGPFIHASFQSDVELVPHLTYSELVERPYQRQEGSGVKEAEPGCLVEPWSNREICERCGV